MSTPTVPDWFRAHGFGLLCIHQSGREHFVIVAADDDGVADLTARGLRLWVATSADGVATQLIAAGFSEAETHVAIAHAREWATTITRDPDAPPVLWELETDR